MRPIRLFTGCDQREAVGLTVFLQSVLERSSRPVAFTPISSAKRDGTNAFTYARFLVPYLCGFEGVAVFADGVDMMLRSDIAELVDAFQEEDASIAAAVVKHDYRTQHPRKYRGTDLEADNADYPRKNWSSLIIWRCDHPANMVLTPAYVDRQPGSHLHRFAWLEDRQTGGLPGVWNWLADEYGFNAGAKLVHWTAGIPGFNAYWDAPFADEWRTTMGRAMGGLQTHLLVEAESLKISQR